VVRRSGGRHFANARLGTNTSAAQSCPSAIMAPSPLHQKGNTHCSRRPAISIPGEEQWLHREGMKPVCHLNAENTGELIGVQPSSRKQPVYQRQRYSKRKAQRGVWRACAVRPAKCRWRGPACSVVQRARRHQRQFTGRFVQPHRHHACKRAAPCGAAVRRR